MDWSNERYVRLYTRNTAAWVLWPWQARALFPLLMRAADRAGVIDNSEGPAGVAALVMLPLEVAEVGLAALMKGDSAPVVETPSGYVIRNFLDAQEAAQSPQQRSRESRARRRDVALHGDAVRAEGDTKRGTADTKHVDPDTDGHAASQSDTDGHSVPFCSVPSGSEKNKARAGDLTERRRLLGNRLWQEHMAAHERLRAELKADSLPLRLMGEGRRLIAQVLLEQYPTLDGAEDDCTAYLRKREAQARSLGHIGYFGDAMWNRDEWAKRGRLDAKPAKRTAANDEYRPPIRRINDEPSRYEKPLPEELAAMRAAIEQADREAS